MDPILLKYRGNDSEYLIYDSEKFHSCLHPKAVRSICARNFGLGTQGVMVGPVRKDGGLVMQIFSPDGEEKQMGEDALAASRRYLQDAGYIKMEHIMDQEDTWNLYHIDALSSNEVVTNITVLK